MNNSSDPNGEDLLLELRHASLFYGTVVGVNDIDIRLPRGAYALLGPNGAGKSTMIGLITGAMKPTIGTVKLFGVNPRKSLSVMSKVGFCPATDLLLHNVSVRQWLLLQLALSGWPTDRAKQRVEDLLKQVDLSTVGDRSLHTFSLGMRQRAKFAQAIAHFPELLILDEPFNGLDPIARQHLTMLLQDWVNEGKSLIVASHVLHELENIVNSFLLINNGRLLASGTPGQLRSLLNDLPEYLSITCSNPRFLASLLVADGLVNSIEFDPDQQTLLVDSVESERLQLSLAKWSVEHSLRIDRLRGADGNFSRLFQFLVAKQIGIDKIKIRNGWV